MDVFSTRYFQGSCRVEDDPVGQLIEAAEAKRPVSPQLPQPVLARKPPGTQIPQKRYTGRGELYSKYDPVEFNLAGSDHYGVPLKDILEKTAEFNKLVDSHSPFPDTQTVSFSLRMEWPGRAATYKTIASLDWKSPRRPKTRAKIAQEVAKAISEVLKKPGAGQWACVRPEQLSLIRLHHVSRNSWQPEICLLS